MLEVWLRTVFSEMPKDPAICRSLMPWARALITSSSLSVSGGGESCGLLDLPLSKVLSIFWARSGAMMVLPAWTVWMARERSSGSESFEQVALRAGLYALEDVLVLLVPGEDDHRGLRQEVPDLPRSAYAVHLGHRDVHQDHVGLFLAAQRDGLLAVVGHAHHLHAGQHVDEAGEALGEEPLVVHDRHADDLFFAVAQEPRLLLSSGHHVLYCVPVSSSRLDKRKETPLVYLKDASCGYSLHR